MLKNFFKIAIRNLSRSKGYSAINIGGLAVGMAVALLIGLWIYDELSFNKYHTNYDNIAQVMQHANFNGEIASQVSNPALMGPALKEKFGSDFKYVVQASWIGDQLLSIGNKQYSKTSIFIEPDAVDMLSLKMLKGTRQALKDPYSIILSESTAAAIFGKDDPINKVLKLDRIYDVKVTGVFEDLPDNTTFHSIQIFLPWELWFIENPWGKNMENPWGSNFSQTYVQIADNADMQKVSAKIKNIKMDQVNEAEK